MREVADPLEPLGPVIEILLVAEFAVFHAVVAPLDAALAPPTKRFEPTRVAFEGDPLHAVDAVDDVPLVLGREAVRRDAD